ncbi:hypothetical protein [Methylobacterium segetis]|uniref:hypothetical protein n=1 Tax=Methylobacterium segetis TaxID=2488750 RepID=UPI00104D8758|nr:hypothetical protein [Methylobacterium segetis]
MTELNETPLEMARRHVVEGEARCARQAALVDRLRAHGHDTAVAEDLLAELEATLVDMREHRRRLENDQGDGR